MSAAGRIPRRTPTPLFISAVMHPRPSSSTTTGRTPRGCSPLHQLALLSREQLRFQGRSPPPASINIIPIFAADVLLHQLTSNPTSRLHLNQWEAIDNLVNGHGRLIVVQRTGWGKSAVYFIAAKSLREMGAGPAVIVSPLLALMRNQVKSAARAGIKAVTINSSNVTEWEEITAEINAGEVDLLLVSPERLNNPDFRANVVP